MLLETRISAHSAGDPAATLRLKKSLNTREWSVAAATVHEWEAAREIGGKRKDIPSVKEAVSKYLEDSEARQLAAPTIRKRRELLEGKLLPDAHGKRPGRKTSKAGRGSRAAA